MLTKYLLLLMSQAAWSKVLNLCVPGAALGTVAIEVTQDQCSVLVLAGEVDSTDV